MDIGSFVVDVAELFIRAWKKNNMAHLGESGLHDCKRAIGFRMGSDFSNGVDGANCVRNDAKKRKKKYKI